MSKLLMVVTAIIGLIVAAFVALLILLDNPEAYKQRLSDTFEATTGYGLEINGTLDWQYFPPIAIGMSQVAVTIPEMEAPLASLNSASVDLKLWPLLFGGSVEVSGVTLDGLTINAVVDKNGRGNWEVASTQATEDATNETSDQNSSDDTSLQIDIGGVSITNTLVNYNDQSSNSHYVISLSEFTTGPLGTGITTDISGEMRIEDKISGLIVSNSIRGKAAINESLDEFNLDGLALNTTIEQPDAPALETKLTLSGIVNTGSETAKLNNTSIEVGGAKFDLSLSANNLFGETQFEGKVTAAPFNAKALLQALAADPGPMANPAALSKVSLNADLNGDLNQVNLSNLKIGLDQTTLSGTLGLGLAAITAINFDLGLDTIDLSDYLPAEPENAGTDASATTTVITDSEIIPRELLTSTHINGKFAIQNLQYDTWTLSDVNLTVNNKDSALAVNGTAAAYEGNISFKLNSNNLGAKPATSTTFTVNGVDIAKALEVETITGTIELDAKHQFTGAMMSDLTKTLDGSATFNIADGTLDVRPIKQLAAIVDGIQGSKSGIGDWPDLMPFKSLNGNHKINQGISANQTFAANLENMRITGKGGIDYFANQLSYDIETVLLENVGGQFTVNPKLTGVKWPITCAGPLDADPVSLCLPDRAAVASLIQKMAVEAARKQGRDALEKKIEEKVPEELKDAAKGLLKGLFGN